jgi:peroxiredoxin
MHSAAYLFMMVALKLKNALHSKQRWRRAHRPCDGHGPILQGGFGGAGVRRSGARRLPAQTPGFSGTTLDGRAFTLDAQRGRVVMVLLWRTDCAVCLSKMPELRANALGWKGKPFDLVTISLDPRSADTENHDRTRRLVAAAEGPVWSFWQGQVQMPDDWRKASRVPVMLIIDRDGHIAARHEGRVPADVWDSVADLLP